MKVNKKFIASATSAALVASAIVPVASAASFSDIENNTHKDAILALAEAGIISGYTDGTFKPNAQVTRGNVTKLLGKWLVSEGYDIPADFNTVERFTDLPVTSADQELVKYAALVKDAEVFKGSNGKLIQANNMSREQMAVVLVRAIKTVYGIDLIADYKAAKFESAITDFDKAIADYHESITALEFAGLTTQKTFNPKGTVTRGQFASFLDRAIKYAAKQEVKVEVESVSAINAKTLEVNFSKELSKEEQAKVTFEVKVNGTVAPFKVDGVAGKSTKLVRTSALALEAGAYEVTVKGLGENQTKTFTVEAQKATSLEVTSSSLLDDTNKAKVGLELKDQYGTVLTLNNTEFTATGFNVTTGKPVTLTWDAALKSYVVDTKTAATDFVVNDKIKVSFFHSKSGLVATKELTVVSGASLHDVKFGNIELPTGKTLLTQDLTNVKVPVTAVDQYGNTVGLVKDNNVVVVSSDSSIVNPTHVSFTSEGTPAVAKLQIAQFGGYGNVTLTLVNKATGDVYRLPLEVKQQAGVISKVALEKSTLEIAQGGSAVAVDLKVTDNYDNVIKAANYASGSAFTITTSNNAVATAAINNTASDANYGKLVVTPVGGSAKGQSAVITVTVNATGETSKLHVTIGETAVASSITVGEKSEHATNLAVGASTTVKFNVFDQYGNAVSNQNDYKVKYSVKDAAEAITLTGASNGVVTDEDESNTSVEVNAAKAGSATLVAKLVKGTDEVIATKEISFNVVANSSAQLTYALEAIPTLYKAGSIAGEDFGSNGTDVNETIVAADVAAGYAKEVKLTAKDASGNVVSIPADQIISVNSSSTKVLVGKVDGKYYVAGNDSALTADEKATISVVYNAEDGVKTLTQEVTVSKDALKVTSVQFKDKAVGETDAKDVTSLTVENKAALVHSDGFGDVFLWAQDQFGGYTVAATKSAQDAALSFKVISGVTSTTTTGDTITVVENGKLTGKLLYNDNSSDLAITADNAKLRLIANFGGVAGSLDIIVKSHQ